MKKKTAIVKQLQGITFAAKTDSNHWIMMDGSPDFGGSNAGTSPKDLLLLGLGGCTASDVVAILRKKRSPVSGLEIRLTASIAEEHPKVFTEIHLEYVVSGEGINPADVERAVELSTTKYCAVSAMLQPKVKLTHSYTIQTPSPQVPA